MILGGYGSSGVDRFCESAVTGLVFDDRAVEHVEHDAQVGGQQDADDVAIGCGLEGVPDGIDQIFVGLYTVDRHKFGQCLHPTQDLGARGPTIGHGAEQNVDLACAVEGTGGREGLQASVREGGGLCRLVLHGCLGLVGLIETVVRLVVERVHQSVEVEAGAGLVGCVAGLRVLLTGVGRVRRTGARSCAREPVGVGRLLAEFLLAFVRDGSQQVADHADAGGRELADAASERDVLGDDLLFGVLGADGLEAAVAASDEVDLELADLPGGSGVVAGVAVDQLDVVERLGEQLGCVDDERAVGADARAVGVLLLQLAGELAALVELPGVPALSSLETFRGALVVLRESVEARLEISDTLGELLDEELLRLAVVALPAAPEGHVLDDDGAVLVERDVRTLVGGQFGGRAGLRDDLLGGVLRYSGLGGFGHGSEPLPRAIYSHLENSNHWNLNSVDLHNEVRDDNRLFLKK